jgi:serine/threonine protein kinase
MYEVLTGKSPFFDKNDDVYAVIGKHKTAVRPMIHLARPDLNLQVSEVFRKAMSIDPKQRYKTCKAFAKAFEEAAVVQPPTRSKLLLFARIIVVIVVVGLLGAIAIGLTRNPPFCEFISSTPCFTSTPSPGFVTTSPPASTMSPTLGATASPTPTPTISPTRAPSATLTAAATPTTPTLTLDPRFTATNTLTIKQMTETQEALEAMETQTAGAKTRTAQAETAMAQATPSATPE